MGHLTRAPNYNTEFNLKLIYYMTNIEFYFVVVYGSVYPSTSGWQGGLQFWPIHPRPGSALSPLPLLQTN